MAIIPSSQYTGQITPGDTNYPYGSAVNVSAPGALDGTPLSEEWVNDDWALRQAMLIEAGITPNGTVDTVLDSDHFDAMRIMMRADRKLVNASNTPGFETTQVTIEPCTVWDNTGQHLISLKNTITKDFTGVWVAGDGNGGRRNVAIANNQNWNLLLIKNATTGDVDAILDTDIDGSAGLAQAGYDYAARVSFYTTGAATNDLQLTIKDGDIFSIPLFDQFHVTGATGTMADATLKCPAGVNVEARISASFGMSGFAAGGLAVRENGFNGDNILIASGHLGEGSGSWGGTATLRTDTQAKIQWLKIGSATGGKVSATSWRDFLSIL
jgi:hypothetical protein